MQCHLCETTTAVKLSANKVIKSSTYFYVSDGNCMIINNINNGDSVLLRLKFPEIRLIAIKSINLSKLKKTVGRMRSKIYLSVNGRTLIANLTLEIFIFIRVYYKITTNQSSVRILRIQCTSVHFGQTELF